MNGGTQEELLRLNNGHPRRTNISEKNYTAKTYNISTQEKTKSKIIDLIKGSRESYKRYLLSIHNQDY